jgi:hypothetical protein
MVGFFDNGDDLSRLTKPLIYEQLKEHPAEIVNNSLLGYGT